MKKKIFAAYFMAAMSLFTLTMFSSCDQGTFLGTEEEVIKTNSELEYLSYEKDFELRSLEVYTKKQNVNTSLVQYSGKVEVSRKSFVQPLNLNVRFNALQDVSVKTEAELQNVALKNVSQSGISNDTTKIANGCKLIDSDQNFMFVFDQEEGVTAKSLYEKMQHDQEVFPYGEVRSVSYKDFASQKNEALSNAEQTAYLITLRFDVDVVVNEAISRAVDANIETYTIEVPYNRIYKKGSTPEEDKYVKTIVIGTSDVIKGSNRVISVTTAEIWSKSGQINQTTETISIPFFVKNPEDLTVYTTSADYRTASNGKKVTSENEKNEGNWTITTRTAEYSSSATNGATPFDNVYQIQDGKVKYQKKEAEVEFPYGTWTISEGETIIGTPTQDGNFKVYPYQNNIDYLYAITNDQSKGSGYAKRKIYIGEGQRVKTVIVDYSDKLVSGGRELSVTTAEVWSDGERHNLTTETKVVPFSLTAPEAQKIYTSNASYVTTAKGMSLVNEKSSVDGNWKITTRNQVYSSEASNGANPFSNKYSATDCKVVYTKDEATVSFPYGTWTVSEGKTTIGSAVEDGDYEMYPYVNNINYTYAITDDSFKGSAKADRSIYVKVEKDEYIKTIIVSYTDEIDGSNRVISVTTAEVWSKSGQHASETETIRLPLTWSNPSMQSIYTVNVNYLTNSNGWKSGNESNRQEGNFNVTTRTSSYSSTASNNDKNFNNVYSMSDSKARYSKKEVSLDFGYGTWNVTEGQSVVGNVSKEGFYNVYPYTNNVSYTYSITSGSKSGNGIAKAKLYVVPKIIPDEWGKIIGAGISAVPSDDLGESVNVAKKCLTIRTEKGAVAVVFDWSRSICDTNNILSGYFVEGSFDASYNSGYYTTSTNRGSYALGKWAPAKAMDLSNRIAYYNGSKCVRNVPFTTLQMWGWANGQSTVVSGYTFQVSDNGTLTIIFNGQTILSIR